MRYILTILFLVINTFAYDAFITVDDLKKSLADNKLIILDVNSRESYDTSHILGALHVEMSNYVNIQDNVKHLPLSLDLQEELRELGINEDSNIVIYSRSSQQEQLNSSYLAFVLIYNGFTNVSILNGGYMAWVFKNNRFVSSSEPDTIDGFFSTNENPDLIASTQYIQDNLSKLQILDSRLSSYYFGTKKLESTKNFGHIPGAKSSYYKDKFLEDLELRSDKQLDEIFMTGLELDKNKEVIVYGESMYSASMNWYILYQKLGFKKAKIYEASFFEWNNLDLETKSFKWE